MTKKSSFVLKLYQFCFDENDHQDISPLSNYLINRGNLASIALEPYARPCSFARDHWRVPSLLTHSFTHSTYPSTLTRRSISSSPSSLREGTPATAQHGGAFGGDKKCRTHP
eukprot:GHVU01017817.1.p2 GENE.GHVU01017817.1~~GHVU01017817.1.p2  ORF type:complete len:112 (+),score=0.19 GHVU01017817.1:1146-1481(+)